jgi:hypothetical protein
LLAGINLAIALPPLVWQEKTYWRFTQAANSGSSASMRLVRVSFQEEMTIPFNPCDWFDLRNQPMEVTAFANLPAAVLTGWYDPCLVKTRLGRAVARVFGTRNHRAEIARCLALSACIFVEWTLVGGFPLVHPRRWWLEPGAVITLCAIVGILLSLLPYEHAFARTPEMVAGLAWLCWSGLLVWRTFQGLHRAFFGRIESKTA